MERNSLLRTQNPENVGNRPILGKIDEANKTRRLLSMVLRPIARVLLAGEASKQLGRAYWSRGAIRPGEAEVRDELDTSSQTHP